jgi:hypothetical protein
LNAVWTGVREMYSDSLHYSVAVERLKAELEILKAELGTGNSALDPANAADEVATTEQATAAVGGDGVPARRQTVGRRLLRSAR